MKKPDFSEILYNPNCIAWGHGNNAVGPQLLARIQLREPTKKELALQKKDYEAAKQIYDQYINVHQQFKAGGEGANKDIIAAITFIHAGKQTITWKQINCPPQFRPAAGKFSINAVIAMYRAKKIIFL